MSDGKARFWIARGRCLKTSHRTVTDESEDPEIHLEEIGGASETFKLAKLNVFAESGLLVKSSTNPYAEERVTAKREFEEDKRKKKENTRRARKARADEAREASARAPASQDGEQGPRIGVRPKGE